MIAHDAELKVVREVLECDDCDAVWADDYDALSVTGHALREHHNISLVMTFRRRFVSGKKTGD